MEILIILEITFRRKIIVGVYSGKYKKIRRSAEKKLQLSKSEDGGTGLENGYLGITMDAIQQTGDRYGVFQMGSSGWGNGGCDTVGGDKVVVIRWLVTRWVGKRWVGTRWVVIRW